MDDLDDLDVTVPAKNQDYRFYRNLANETDQKRLKDLENFLKKKEERAKETREREELLQDKIKELKRQIDEQVVAL